MTENIWLDGERKDEWISYLTGRMKLCVKRYRDIYGCAIIFINGIKQIFIALGDRDTKDAAMRYCIEWGESYIKNGPNSPDRLFAECYKHYPDLYKTRLDIIDQVFFTIGNGYEWLDGAPIYRYSEDYRLITIRQSIALFKKALGHDAKLVKQINSFLNKKDSPERPLPDDGKQRCFYRVSKHSLIMNVPDDVRSEWLDVVFEAAILLKDRSGSDERYSLEDIANHQVETNENNKTMGEFIINSLEVRFPEHKGIK